MSLAAPLPSPVWGNLIGTYFVLIGLPSGLGLISWWMAVRRQSSAALQRTADMISLIALVLVGAILIVDLGRPERFYLMLTRFDRVSSPISVGAKLISVKAGLLGLTVYADKITLFRKSSTTAQIPPRAAQLGQRIVRAALAAASFALALYPASVLSRTWSSPLAGSSGSAMLFTLTALLLGAGAVGVLSSLLPSCRDTRDTARHTMAVLLGAYTIAIIFEALAIGGDPRWHAISRSLTVGASAAPFWGGVVGAGVILPAILLAAGRRSRTPLAAASAAVIAGACVARYLMFSVGA